MCTPLVKHFHSEEFGPICEIFVCAAELRVVCAAELRVAEGRGGSRVVGGLWGVVVRGGAGWACNCNTRNTRNTGNSGGGGWGGVMRWGGVRCDEKRRKRKERCRCGGREV